MKPVFVTWLRHPVDRLISHYRFWMRADDPTVLPVLHRRVVQEHWNLERFCLSPELRNLYHQFLFGFPVERLGFVGIVERMDQDFPLFAQRCLGSDVALELPRLNVGDNLEKLGDTRLRSKIEAYHAKDMALYRRFAGRPVGQ